MELFTEQQANISLLKNKTLGGCPDGVAKVSGGYNLPANAYRNCLDLMIKKGLRLIVSKIGTAFL